MSFYDKTCMQRLETESCLGLTGLGSHNFICSKQKQGTPQSPLCPNPLDAEKCHFWQKKKSMQAYYLKKCVKMLFLFFFCKILQFIVIYKCKLWYQLTFL